MMNYQLNLGYHKGSLCPVKYQICQEGYCSDCRISREQIMASRVKRATKRAAPVLARAALT